MQAAIQQIQGLIDKIYGNNLIAKLEFKAYTPWRGGCSHSKTIVVDKAGNVIDVCLPEAKPLIGRARWLARVVAATVVGGAHRYEQVEAVAVKLFGSTNHASLFTVKVKPSANRAQLVKTLDRIVKNLASQRAVRQRNLLDAVLAAVEQGVGEKGFSKLADNARLRLAVMGLRSLGDVLAKIPLPPRLVRGFSVEIAWRPGVRKTVEAAKAATALLAATPLLVGLGSTTSRGFGRFCLTGYETPGLENSDELRKLFEGLSCDKLAALGEGEAADHVSALFGMLANTIKPFLEKQAGVVKHTGVPIVSRNYIEAIAINGDIYDALNAASKATTKQCWKKIAGLNVKKPGSNLHTWPLGLPRRQETGGYIIASLQDSTCLNRLEGSEGRRLSMIHVFPLPSPHGRTVAVAIGYLAYDMVELVENRGMRLYHVGRYIVGYRRDQRTGKKRPIWSNYHYISVGYIAANPRSEISDPCGTGHREPGGLLYPRGSVKQPLSSYRLVEEAFKAAFDFVVEALRRGC